ncbi:hypothetical protein HBB16_18635 [Pseudonocardia sp. MCCB 268]|nr:hypothetical protein [Pseudonocardia cytotoxica]
MTLRTSWRIRELWITRRSTATPLYTGNAGLPAARADLRRPGVPLRRALRPGHRVPGHDRVSEGLDLAFR